MTDVSADPAGTALPPDENGLDHQLQTHALQMMRILESATGNVFALDTDWRFTYLNRRAIDDIAKGRDLLGQIFWDAFPETIDSPFEEACRRAMREQTPVSFEAYDEPFETWYEVHAYPSPHQLTVFFQNVTQRKRNEQAIAAHQAELDEVQQLARISRWEYHPATDWISFSSNASDVVAPVVGPEGCSATELIRLVHPQDRIAASKFLTQPLKCDTCSDLEIRLQIPGERDRFLILRAQPGNGPTVRGMMQDVTAQRRAELARQSTENRFRMIFESAIGGITITTPEGQFIEVNPAFAATMGYTREELRRMTFQELTHPDDRERNTDMLQRLLAGEIPSSTIEQRSITKSGEIVRLRLHISKVTDELTGTHHLIAIIHDITRQKLAEDALQNSEAQLRQAQKMEAVERLAGGIAHDFNNLLTVINGYSSLLLTELPSADPIRETIERIASAGEKASGLTNQLMAFSRKQVLRATTLDINQVVNGLEPLLRRLIREDITLTVLPAPAHSHVHADQSQLEQVLLNLCMNSRDAMPAGGQLTIAIETVTVRLEDARFCPELGPGEYVRLAVSDTGHGMEEATRLRAFEPFFTTKGKEGGSGLGLATVYGVIKQSDGHVTLHSTPEKGTTVHVYLPRVTPQVAAPARKRSGNASSLRGNETILLAEDEPEIRGFLTSILRQNGYEVLSAAHGAEALAIAQEYQGPIHLLASDMTMPGMNGRTLAKQIREARPDTKVLFISGYIDNELDPATDLNDEVQFLKKPFTPRDLMRSIRALLDTAK